MNLDIIESPAYKIIADLLQEELMETFDKLVACRDADEKTFLQGKIVGLNFLERFEEDVAMDIEEAKAG